MYKKTVLLSLFLLCSTLIFSSPYKGDGSRQARVQDRVIYFSAERKKQTPKNVDSLIKKINVMKTLRLRSFSSDASKDAVDIAKKNQEDSQRMILATMLADLDTGSMSDDVFERHCEKNYRENSSVDKSLLKELVFFQQVVFDRLSNQHLCNKMRDL